jgi:hypothetical protein
MKLYRSKKMIQHHIINKCKGGGNQKSNLLRFERNREKAWHYLFRNRSIKEVIAILGISKILLSRDDRRVWYFLFGHKSVQEVIELLKRVDRAKSAQ